MSESSYRDHGQPDTVTVDRHAPCTPLAFIAFVVVASAAAASKVSTGFMVFTFAVGILAGSATAVYIARNNAKLTDCRDGHSA